MAELPDLTGQNIQDTYQRILTVGDGGHMFDGTGSIFVPLSASVEVTKEISSSHADIADGLTGQPSISVTNTETLYVPLSINLCDGLLLLSI